MQILHWGTFDLGKPRTRILRTGIAADGMTLRDCHSSLWDGLEDKTQDVGPLLQLAVLFRMLVGYPVLIWRFLRGPRPELVLTSFPGVLDTIVLAPFARLRRVPLVFDLFISAYDTLVFERRLVREGTWRAALLRRLERVAIRAADLVFLDSETHARRIEALFDLPHGSCGSVLVGTEIEHFRPAPTARPSKADGSQSSLRVLFYGQFIPLHGIETIVKAARQLQGEPIEWTLIGRGQEARRIRDMLEEVPLPKLQWLEWVEYSQLRESLAEADLCLGIFGTSEKAASVIPNKVYQTLAAGRPIVTRDSPAIRELLTHEPPCVYLVPPADPDALASAVLAHRTTSPPPVCHSALARRIDASAVGRQFTELIKQRLGR